MIKYTIDDYAGAYDMKYTDALLRRGTRPLAILAEGDSWFMGPGNGVLAMLDNLLEVPILSLADAGDDIGSLRPLRQHMTSAGQMGELARALERHPFDALLLSGGGNDVVAARYSYIRPHTLNDTLEDIIDTDHLNSVLADVARGYASIGALAQRITPNIKVFVHQYVLPRRLDVGTPFGHGPWFYPAIRDQMPAAPPHDHAMCIVHHVMNRLADTIEFVAQSLPFVLVPTRDIATEAHDWADEMHLNRQGAVKVAQAFQGRIDAQLG